MNSFCNIHFGENKLGEHKTEFHLPVSKTSGNATLKSIPTTMSPAMFTPRSPHSPISKGNRCKEPPADTAKCYKSIILCSTANTQHVFLAK